VTATEQAPTFEGVSKPLAGIRKIAARRMVEAWAAPVFHLSVNVDMSAVLAANLKAIGATVTDAILHASAGALSAFRFVRTRLQRRAPRERAPRSLSISVRLRARPQR
jgi:pyruvate/2-oxoglutarate dehydrogenase complex dihydrolipoamide acyltransferase (E2) component